MPNFGPLSAERPELQGLSTDQALTVIRREIRTSVRQIAPPKPPFSLPHKCGHHEIGPQLWFEPDRQFNLGRWYQLVSYLNPTKILCINYFVLSARLVMTPTLFDSPLNVSNVASLLELLHLVD